MNFVPYFWVMCLFSLFSQREFCKQNISGSMCRPDASCLMLQEGMGEKLDHNSWVLFMMLFSKWITQTLRIALSYVVIFFFQLVFCLQRKKYIVPTANHSAVDMKVPLKLGSNNFPLVLCPKWILIKMKILRINIGEDWANFQPLEVLR